jgi:hypothetical protein
MEGSKAVVVAADAYKNFFPLLVKSAPPFMLTSTITSPELCDSGAEQ